MSLFILFQYMILRFSLLKKEMKVSPSFHYSIHSNICAHYITCSRKRVQSHLRRKKEVCTLSLHWELCGKVLRHKSQLQKVEQTYYIILYSLHYRDDTLNRTLKTTMKRRKFQENQWSLMRILYYVQLIDTSNLTNPPNVIQAQQLYC